MAATRRLAATVAADVAGYSRLMGGDEEATHERLKAHFAESVEPKISEHRGRTVKTTGDAPGFTDVAIAAIAKVGELVVVTLNRRHFAVVAVDLTNLFAAR